MAANPETLTVEDLIAQAIQQESSSRGSTMPDSLKMISRRSRNGIRATTNVLYRTNCFGRVEAEME